MGKFLERRDEPRVVRRAEQDHRGPREIRYAHFRTDSFLVS